MFWPLTWPWHTHSPYRYSEHLLLCQNMATNSAWQVSEFAATKGNTSDRPITEGLLGKLGPGVHKEVDLCPLLVWKWSFVTTRLSPPPRASHSFKHSKEWRIPKGELCFSLPSWVKTLANIQFCSIFIFVVLTRYDQHVGSGGFLTLRPALSEAGPDAVRLWWRKSAGYWAGNALQSSLIIAQGDTLKRGVPLSRFPTDAFCCPVMNTNSSTKLNKTETLRTIQ